MSRAYTLDCKVHGTSASDPIANVVLLHGLGHTEEIVYRDLEDAIPSGVRIHSLRAPFPFGEAPNEGFGWFNIEFDGSGPPKPDLSQEAASRKAIGNFLDTLDPAIPLIIMGFGQGGVMAANLYLQHPERMRLCVVASGRIMPHLLEQHPPGLAHHPVPVIWVHGEQDPVIPIEAAHQAAEQLKLAGIQLTWLPHAGGHEWPDAFSAAVNAEVTKAIRRSKTVR